MIFTGIDPGTYKTAIVSINKKEIVSKAYYENNAFKNELKGLFAKNRMFGIENMFAIEDYVCYGMPVGKPGISTIKFIGQLEQLFEDQKIDVRIISRPTIKCLLCNTVKAKDANVNQVLKDYFGQNCVKHNTEAGITNHLYSALAVARSAQMLYSTNMGIENDD